MSLRKARHQKTAQAELPLEGRGEAPTGQRSGEAGVAADGIERSGTDCLMEEVIEGENLREAWKRVKRNGGSPGIDGMTVSELATYLKANLETLRAQLLDGSYQPQAVRRQTIPKKGGGERVLGIPTVLDRFVQQAILQVLQPRFDPTFSEHSYGFRPGRRAHDAVRAAQRYIQEGRRWVVDVDLERFFDRVNHDVLMGKLAKRIVDKRMLRLIRRFLEAGIMAEGITTERHEGTPQGGPLSPLLANVLLDNVDKELEKRGHSFARYADDCNVYVRSRRAGEDVFRTLRRLYAKLQLRVNEGKSAVARPWDRKFLGYSFWVAKGRVVKLRIANEAVVAFKDRIRLITSRTRGWSIAAVVKELKAYLNGWKAYFGLADTPQILSRLDEWIRHRLRMVQLKQWKTGRTIYRELVARGLPSDEAAFIAAHAKSRWRTARQVALNDALSASYYDHLGVPHLAA